MNHIVPYIYIYIYIWKGLVHKNQANKTYEPHRSVHIYIYIYGKVWFIKIKQTRLMNHIVPIITVKIRKQKLVN